MMMPTLGRARALPPRPAALFFWLHAQDSNLLRNAGIADGATPLTWKNKGTIAAAGNVTQATSGLRPVYRYLAAAGKIKNRSAFEADGTKQMQTSSLTAVATPVTWAVVARQTAVASKVYFSGPSGAAHQLGTSPGIVLQIYSGALVNTGQSVVVNSWHQVGCILNGGASRGDLDGVAGGAVTAGSVSLTGVAVFGDTVGGEMIVGMIADVLGWSGPLGGHATLPEITAYVAREYGATPQA